MFLRKFARPSMMMMMMKMNVAGESAAKESGPVAEVIESTANGRVRELIKIYKKTIKEIQKMPEDEDYRKDLEATTRERLDICLVERHAPAAIEQEIGCGNLEELVNAAEFEYKIFTNLLEWDPWGINENYVSDVVDQYQQTTRPIPGIVPDELYVRLKDLAIEKGPYSDYDPFENESSEEMSSSDKDP